MGEPAEEPQFELDVGDAEETEVELEQPEETPEPEEPAVEVEQETSPDDEIAEYSESVQKRMDESLKYAVKKALRRGLKNLPLQLLPYIKT